MGAMLRSYARLDPGRAAAAACAVFLCSCSSALTATLEVTTRAVEVSVSDRSVDLNPMGDAFVMPEGAGSGSVLWDGGEAEAKPGEEVEVVSDLVGRAPGRVTRVIVAGREVASRDGHMGVRACWRATGERALPPVEWRTEISLEPGGSMDLDQIVMYSCAESSTFRDLRTTYKFSGSDAESFEFMPSAPLEGGRFKGTVFAGRKDGKERGKD